MSVTEVNPPIVPSIVKEWVQANPMPTLLVTKDLELLAVNDAFTKLLTQLALGAKELLRGHLSEDRPVTPAYAVCWCDGDTEDEPPDAV